MNTLSILVQCVGITLLAFLPCFIISNQKLGRRFDAQEPTFLATFHAFFVFIFALLSLVIFYLAYLDVPVVEVLRYLLFPLLFFLIINLVLKRNLSFSVKENLIGLVPIGFAIWQLFPALILMAQKNGELGMITRGNNDLGYYVASSSEFMKSGFRNSSHVASADLNFDNFQNTYFGVTSLFTYFTTMTNFGAISNAMPIMVLASSYAVFSLAHLVQLNFNFKNPVIPVSLSGFATAIPLSNYVTANYFLAQVLALGVASSILVNVQQQILLKKRDLFAILQTASLVVLSLFVYPHFLIPFFLLCIVAANLFKFCSTRRIALASNRGIIIGILLGLLSSIFYLGSSLILLKRQFANSEAGWPIPGINPLNMMVFPQLLGYSFSSKGNLVIWIFSMVILVYLLLKNRNRFPYPVFLVAVFTATITCALVARGRPLGEYTTWKMISYFLPILLALLLGMISSNFQNGKGLSMMFGGLTLSASMTLWIPASYGIQMTSSDLMDLRKIKELQSIKKLNIDLDPYFETMAVISILDKPRLYLNSPSYIPISRYSRACTLINNKNQGFRFAKKLNSTYRLATNELSDCPQVLEQFKLYTLYEFNSLGQNVNGFGWSFPEDWGTWGIAKTSTIFFANPETAQIPREIDIKIRIMKTPRDEKRTLNLALNNINLISREISNQEEFVTLQVPVPQGIVLTEKFLKLDISTSRIISPSEFGKSEDQRKLGIGIVSIIGY